MFACNSHAQSALFVVFNVHSGRGSAQAVREAIARACAAQGRTYRLFEVSRLHRLSDRIREAVDAARAESGVVVAAGGDGTINAVAQAVLGSGCAMGVLPKGTFNYFGRTHAIPTDIDEALRVLLDGQPVPVQAGLVNDRVFLVNASLGLYARVLEDREIYKSRYGRSRWVALWAAMVTAMRPHPGWDLRIQWRGEERLVRTPTLFVGNNALQLQQVGMPRPEAVEQGELTAIALRPSSRLAMLALMLRGAMGRLGESDNVMHTSFRSMSVSPVKTTRRHAKVAADGEVLRMAMPLHFRVAPEPLWLIKPARDEQEDAAR
ncbi:MULTISPECIES: diacylglycerol kinase family protein [unclassified Variovorax]|uniref:diacylglycerol/lipid kinase family protein n=1 Tax=unclassified Variovorax TaxID=663243 RepID=UPI00076BFBF8|nr:MULTISPECIES: diacylglycerol kinase family protein [unclassified Variovorax]KWT97051.1 Transcription regulator [contains diacylglycerol kinase catalytic domain] [Variovorax sp. WDL1]PNG47052.1 Diacylglycerol kinase [Variovorax sp. B2]PNG48297.1 Diacylglycerol kinase [Variovorax sp. B4]VTV14912.1 Diacylglycerol kinase [Variovorax sp. WDL1]